MKIDYSNTSMLDMVFEHRNKSYGAYVLRRDYNKQLAKAVSITVSSVLLLIAGNYIASKLSGKQTNYAQSQVVIDLKDIPTLMPEPKPEPPKPVQQNQAQAKPTVRNTEMRVTATAPVVDSLPTRDELAQLDAGLTTNLTAPDNGMGVDGGQGNVSTFEVVAPAPTPSAEPHTIVQEMPAFPGGEKKLMEFLVKNTIYPDMENDNGIEGRAIVKFVVNEDGRISNAQVLRSDSPGFSKEALRVVGKLPAFKPGKQQGRAVKVYFVLPFNWKQKI